MGSEMCIRDSSCSTSIVAARKGGTAKNAAADTDKAARIHHRRLMGIIHLILEFFGFGAPIRLA